jgi:hypothetical protein
MTSIAVETTAYQAERRSWLIHQPGGIGFGFTPSVTLDVSAFTAATHYPNGYLLSGIVLGKITATSLYGPYNDTLSNGQEVATGLLFSSVKIPNLADLTVDVGAAMVSAFAVVKIAKLPLSGTPTGRGAIDAAAQVDLPRIHFVA